MKRDASSLWQPGNYFETVDLSKAHPECINENEYDSLNVIHDFRSGSDWESAVELVHYRVIHRRIPEAAFFTPDELALDAPRTQGQIDLLNSYQTFSQIWPKLPDTEEFWKLPQDCLLFWRRVKAVRCNPSDEALVDNLIMDLFKLSGFSDAINFVSTLRQSLELFTQSKHYAKPDLIVTSSTIPVGDDNGVILLVQEDKADKNNKDDPHAQVLY
jgi:hypothetical protein